MEAMHAEHGPDDAHDHAEERVERWVPGPQVASVRWMFMMPITMAVVATLVAGTGLTSH